ncbi:MAG: hypothetical protein R2853_00495 [Thermomicrobiales bacterium]|nr:hypothetical protein [Thermomicrobiales bacterium]
MHSSDLSLSHVYAVRRHQEFLAEAEQQYQLRSAFADRIPAPRSLFKTMRAGVAHSLFSFAAWLMPADTRPSERRVAGNWELRLS